MTVNFSAASNIVNPNPIKFPEHPWIVASDDPRNGGITGNIGKFDKPITGACEERPTMTDPVTGEKVYVDVWNRENTPNICYMA